MQQRTLGKNLTVSAIGLGCMGMSEFYGPRDEKEALAALHRATDLGISFFDTADTYGHHHNEELLGRFLAESKPDARVATKFGIVRQPGEYARRLDNSADYIRSACEASLRRLGLECIDLYYVHRIDPATPIEATMHTLSGLVAEGKIAHIGLSEVSAQTLRRAHAVHPITAVQTEYSLWTRDVEAEILPTCRELGVGFVPYAPLGRGFLTGRFHADTVFAADDSRGALPRFSSSNLAANQPLAQAVGQLAARKACTPAQIALAWLLAQGPNIVPIPGTKRVAHLDDNAGAASLTLTSADLAELERSLHGFQAAGARYTDEGMKGVDA